jgi:hypothetical protein
MQRKKPERKPFVPTSLRTWPAATLRRPLPAFRSPGMNPSVSMREASCALLPYRYLDPNLDFEDDGGEQPRGPMRACEFGPPCAGVASG